MMKLFAHSLVVLALVGSVVVSQVSVAQSKRSPAVSVPIKFVDAKPLAAPSLLVRAMTNDAEKLTSGSSVEVVDARFSVDANALAELAPSLQPRLFVGNDYYEVHRVEYENWDKVKGRPADKSKPVGQAHYYHFLIPVERAKSVASDHPVFMTTLTAAEMTQKAGAKLTLSSLEKADGRLAKHVIYLEKGSLLK